MFVIVNVQNICHTKCVGKFTFYLRSKFHSPSSTDSLCIVIKLTNQEILRTVIMLLFLNLKKYYHKNNYTFLTLLHQKFRAHK